MITISDNAVVLIRKLVAEMVHMIHEPHDYEYDYRLPVINCPYEECQYIVKMLRDIDTEFQRM